MNRAQASANLKAFGIAEPTDEQITDYLNQINGESKVYKDKAEKYKLEADKTADLQKQLDELNNANLSELEKANKAKEASDSRVADLEKQIANIQLKASLAEKGIVGENADKLIESLAGGSLDVNILGQIISEREIASANAKEQEIAGRQGNPNGGQGGSAPEKTEAEKVAESVGKSLGGVNKSSADIMSNYIN